MLTKAPRSSSTEDDDRPAEATPLAVDPSVPLAVDLDGTLLLTDTFHESVLRAVLRAPAHCFAAFREIRQGRAAVKRHIAERDYFEVTSLPVRADLISLLKLEKERGRKIYLITAADQAIADRIGAAFDVFDAVKGSDGSRNLKGDAKLAYLKERFADGFIYAGDHPTDQAAFNGAEGVILCDVRRSVVRRHVASGGPPVLATFESGSAPLKAWLQAFRIHQWSKNVLLFVPVILSRQYSDPRTISVAVLAFLLLSLLASGGYILNDLVDLDADRTHASKQHRPFASGRLKIAAGLVTGLLSILIALAGAFVLSPSFALVMLGYFVLTTLYSLRLKKVPLLDVFAIATLFTSRLAMGIEACGLMLSPWLLTFSMFFFFSLALAKRHAEVMRAGVQGLDYLEGRGYRAEDWPLTLVAGISAGIASVVIMLLYMANDAAPSGLYSHIGWLYFVPAFVSLWTLRIWFMSHRMRLHDDPVVFGLRDRWSWLLGLLSAVSIVLAA